MSGYPRQPGFQEVYLRLCERKETVILCAYIEKERGLSGEGNDKLDTTPAPIHEVSK